MATELTPEQIEALELRKHRAFWRLYDSIAELKQALACPRPNTSSGSARMRCELQLTEWSSAHQALVEGGRA